MQLFQITREEFEADRRAMDRTFLLYGSFATLGFAFLFAATVYFQARAAKTLFSKSKSG